MNSSPGAGSEGVVVVGDVPSVGRGVSSSLEAEEVVNSEFQGTGCVSVPRGRKCSRPGVGISAYDSTARAPGWSSEPAAGLVVLGGVVVVVKAQVRLDIDSLRWLWWSSNAGTLKSGCIAQGPPVDGVAPSRGCLTPALQCVAAG